MILHPSQIFPPSRRARPTTAWTGGWLRWAGGVLLLAGLGLLLDETDALEVTHHRLGGGDARLRIALVSDGHLHADQEAARKTLEALHQEPFDLLLLAGDMLDARPHQEALEAFLARLPQGGQRFAVPGNWEYWSGLGARGMEPLYGRHGVRLLVNEAVRVGVPGGGEALLVGLDDPLAGQPDWRKAMAGYGNWRGAVLALAHSPTLRDALAAAMDQGRGGDPARRWMVAGHTHGGQIRLFGWVADEHTRRQPYLAGWYGGHNLPLYVSRGVGTSILPLRVGSRPEVAFFDWGVQGALDLPPS